MTRVLNFNAGPATLPLPALERARAELLDFEGSGMSVMEHSHRGKEYEGVHRDAIARLRRLMSIPSDYEVLFMQGGASMQFALVPMNLLAGPGGADYVITGAWGEKAIAEAKLVAAQGGRGVVRVAASTGEGEGKEKQYRRVPRQAELELDQASTYAHFTSNETIHGVQFAVEPGSSFPDFHGVPVVCDMSSDILWRRMDISRFGLIYAGAQKNIGPSGVTIVIARKSLIEAGRKDIPKILQYRTFAENESLYNTPPTFGIYLARNVLAWIEEVGGIDQIEAWNREKGRILYGAIDRHAGLYSCPVEHGSRSLMNVVFRLPNQGLEDEFVAGAKKHAMVGLKGHRSVGGIRVSTYNAVSVDWIRTLADYMGSFAKSHGE